MTALKLISLFCLLILSACGSSGDGSNGNESGTTTQRLVEITHSMANGSVNTHTIEYSSSGNFQREVFKQDGNIYYISTYETRADGQLIRRSDDADQDGVEDFSSTYTYDSTLGLERIERFNASMLIYQIDIFKFNDGLAVSRDTQDIDDVATYDLVDESSGSLSIRRTFVYENGLVIENNIDTNGNGENDRQEVYSYNPDGTLASTTLSSVTDGVISSAIYTYKKGDCNRNDGNSFTNFYCIGVD